MTQKTSKAKPRPPTLSNSLTVKTGPTGMQKVLKQNLHNKGVRKGVGVKNPPLSLIFYKNFATFARRLGVFAYFLLVNLST